MKIALIRVPTIIDISSCMAMIVPPIGCAYLKAIINKFNRDALVIDSIGNFPQVRKIEDGGRGFWLLGQTAEEIAAALPPDAELLLVSTLFSQDWPYVRTLLRAIRQRCPGAYIVAGGEHITATPEYSMTAAPELDLCVLGEGERTLEELLTRLHAGETRPLDVPGTCVRLGDGTLRRNPRRDRVENPGELPLPDWDAFPLESYFAGRHSFGVHRGRSMPILATRGCPYQCTFCSSPQMWTTKYKARTPEDVVAEMRLYKTKYGATNFDFYDLTAIVRKDWILKFTELLIAEKLEVTWQLPSGTRSEAIDDEVARRLYAAGCRNFAYAPESGSPEVLESIKKRIHVPVMLKSMRSSARAGISTKANVLCGFPGERRRHLLETLGFVARMAWAGVDDVTICLFVPYPGSELFEGLLAAGKVVLNEDYFESLSFQTSMTHARTYNETFSNAEIIAFRFVGLLLFYFVQFVRRPTRFLGVFRNLWRGVEHSRMEKALRSYLDRSRALRL